MPEPLVFIIPVRHQDNSRDWNQLKFNLSQTLKSIEAQTHSNWRGIVVANAGADLPPLPSKFEAAFVDFPPNPHYDLEDDLEAYYEAVRFDKGRRILAGLYRAQTSGHIMLVDDDDFVHRDLAAFAARDPTANGWFIKVGYLWDEGRLLFKYRDFSHLCGTSHIIRADLFGLPLRMDDVTESFICRTLGSHRFIAEDLAAAGTPLAVLPFAGAVYRVGHRGAHSQSDTILRKFFYGPEARGNPPRVIRRLPDLRLSGAWLRRDFFGESA
jgi:hypothetical protein